MSHIESMKINLLKEELSAGQYGAYEIFLKQLKQGNGPLIEEIADKADEVLLTVIWIGDKDTKTVSVFGELFGTDTSLNMLEKLADTDLWYKSYIVPRNTRSLYVFIINDDEELDLEDNDVRLDPFNPNVYTCTKDPLFPKEFCVLFQKESMLELPDFEVPKEQTDSDDFLDRIKLVRHYDKSINTTRRVWEYRAGETKKELLIFLDGYEYIYETKAINTIEYLVEHGLIPPVEAVFIDNRPNRMQALTFNDEFAEMVKSIVRNKGYDKATLIGFSLGGLMASYMALRDSKLFPRVLCQSGALYYDPSDEAARPSYIVKSYDDDDSIRTKFYMSIGLLESKSVSHYEANLDMVRIFDKKKIPYRFDIHPGGHTNLDAVLTLGSGLKYLLNE